MTINTILMIIGISLVIVFLAVALDAIPGYLRDKRAWEAEQRSYQAMELARQTESTMAMKVVEEPRPQKNHGKHRFLAA